MLASQIPNERDGKAELAVAMTFIIGPLRKEAPGVHILGVSDDTRERKALKTSGANQTCGTTEAGTAIRAFLDTLA